MYALANEPALTLQTSAEQEEKTDPKGERKAEANAHPGVFILTQNARAAILWGAGQPSALRLRRQHRMPRTAQDAAAGLARIANVFAETMIQPTGRII